MQQQFPVGRCTNQLVEHSFCRTQRARGGGQDKQLVHGLVAGGGEFDVVVVPKLGIGGGSFHHGFGQMQPTRAGTNGKRHRDTRGVVQTTTMVENVPTVQHIGFRRVTGVLVPYTVVVAVPTVPTVFNIISPCQKIDSDSPTKNNQWLKNVGNKGKCTTNQVLLPDTVHVDIHGTVRHMQPQIPWVFQGRQDVDRGFHFHTQRGSVVGQGGGGGGGVRGVYCMHAFHRHHSVVQCVWQKIKKLKNQKIKMQSTNQNEK